MPVAACVGSSMTAIAYVETRHDAGVTRVEQATPVSCTRKFQRVCVLVRDMGDVSQGHRTVDRGLKYEREALGSKQEVYGCAD